MSLVVRKEQIVDEAIGTPLGLVTEAELQGK